jgi:hypothetical protein
MVKSSTPIPFDVDASVVVYVTYDGLVAESYPVQGGAKLYIYRRLDFIHGNL